MRLTVLLAGYVLVGANRNAAQTTLPARFESKRIAAYSDSFATIVQGQERGWHTFSMQRTDSGFLYQERFDLPGMMGRDLRIVFGPALTVRSVTATGTLMGHMIGAQLAYAGQRATGWAITDIETTPRRVTVDTVLPTGAFDGAALMAVLPALNWEAGASYSITMFDSDEMNITTQTVRIAGPERITVPAGTFEAYRADLSTTQLPVRLWYTRESPHRLLKLGGDTDGFVTVLVRHR